MNWHDPVRASRALVLQLGAGGWMSTSSVSRQPQRLESEALPVLEAFAEEAEPREVLEALRREWEVDDDEFASVVDRLLEEGLLVARGGAPTDLASGGFASVLSHFHMIRDRRRVEAYRAGIERLAPGRRVVEVGCGSGILSLLAAKAGASSVVAIEESEIAGLARAMVVANGFEEVVEIVTANSRDVTLDEPAEVLIHELFGSDPFEENFLSIIADARDRFLVPGGKLIPHRLEVACRGFEVDTAAQAERQAAVAEARAFGALHDLDFEPLATALSGQAPVRFTAPMAVPAGEPFDRRLLTAEARIFDLDLESASASALPADFEVELLVEQGGLLGGVATYFRAHMDPETVLSTSPIEPPTHWGWNLAPLREAREVRAGEAVRLRVRTHTVRGVPRTIVDLPAG